MYRNSRKVVYPVSKLFQDNTLAYDSLRKRLHKYEAELLELYRMERQRPDGTWFGVYWRVKVKMVDGTIRKWWWTSPTERHPRWKWDGQVGAKIGQRHPKRLTDQEMLQRVEWYREFRAQSLRQEV